MKRVIVLFLTFFVLSLFASNTPHALQIVKYPMGFSKDDFRYSYPMRVLQLALDKTAGEYGSAKAVHAVIPMTKARMLVELDKGELLDVITSGSSDDMLEKYSSVPLCIRKGLLGIRIFLINAEDQRKFSSIRTINDLKKMSAGQGIDWLDTRILLHNNFNVVTCSNYEGLFGMLTARRFDYFPRAVYEVAPELEKYSGQYPNLSIEKKLALYYPDPDFFWVKKGNSILAKRLKKGLTIAIADGSFDKMFYEEFGETLRNVALDKRRIFYIPNTELDFSTPSINKDFWYLEQLIRSKKVRIIE